jgi:hypothetical protein
MGLKEKQLLASRDWSSAQKRIKEAIGQEMKFEAAAETFNDEDSILYLESAGSNRIANAIAYICRDDIGKDAFKDKKVSKIIFRNEAGSKGKLDIKDGILTVAMDFSKDRMGEDDMKTALENLL